MAKTALNPQLLADLVAASPEGFFKLSELHRYSDSSETTQEILSQALSAGTVGTEGAFVFDPVRLTAEQVRERSQTFSGSMTGLTVSGQALQPVTQRINHRTERVQKMKDPVLVRLMNTLANTVGYIERRDLCTESGDEGALATLLDQGILKASDSLIFDPLRITRGSIRELRERQVIIPVREALTSLLESKPGKTAPRTELIEQFGANILHQAMEGGGFGLFTVPTPMGEVVWVRLKGSDVQEAYNIALESVKPKDEDWLAFMPMAGNTLRRGAHEGQDARERLIAHTYTINQAISALGVRKETVASAIAERRLMAFFDPEGIQRIAAEGVEHALNDPDLLSEITGLEVITIRDLAIVLNESPRTIEQKVRRAKLGSMSRVRWRQVAGLWGLPETFREFRKLYTDRKQAWTKARDEERAVLKVKRDEERQKVRAQKEEHRRQRDELRARLLASFPTWQHPGRVDQQVLLHIGPPNSGKTHSALDALSIAENGWYLAPLRLLAFEVFDRLNQRGIKCSLLTGEEYIPVPGAKVTAATIEMFDPSNSGDVVVIDEAQMLADPDRGWAWTRAMMEAQAPDIHVIGPPNSRDLIERLASAAAIPVQIIEHARLAGLDVATESWPLEKLPPRTILVAFSRRMVLHLKTELEMHKRSVSVVYGNLPPEVRRRQADRFAEGKTEICVATDAVGMGLNLPADYVCFFEMEKFDGKNMRPLSAAEVHQIGGRAGRYGMSNIGLVGATNKRNLKVLQRLFNITPHDLTYARVAPTVEDLNLIPGSLAHRFAQWSELQSIPESLRNVIKPADIDERIALARMLSDKEVEYLGLEAAVKLVNAPTREITRDYWRACTQAILANEPMPLPPEAPFLIESNFQLDETERSISCADIYLWLGRRQDFRGFAPDEERVREMRSEWSMSIDAALLRKLDTLARCVNCRKPLPLGHRYSLCDNCYNQRVSHYYY
jgi:hypothetical protein